jgi:hypothetical protein
MLGSSVRVAGGGSSRRINRDLGADRAAFDRHRVGGG